MFCICTVLPYIFGIAGLSVLGLCIFLRKFTTPYPDVFRSKTEKLFLDPVSGDKTQFPSILESHSIHLSVVVPAYEEEERLPPMLEECISYLEERQKKNINFKYEVIIVSDGSKDRTADVALKYTKEYGTDKIRLLNLDYNRGKGGAVRMGVDSARGAVILYADADGATKFPDLAKLEAALLLLLRCDYTENPSMAATSDGIICGSRAHLEKEAIANRSLFRNLLMHGFHFLVWLFTVRSLRDTQCGFKLLTRQSARTCFQSLHINRWAFDVELLYIAEKLNIPIVEVSVRWTEIEGSKLVPFWSWLQMGRDLILIWLRYATGAWKLVQH